MDELKALLATNFSFEEGFSLFCKYSRRESLIKYIARKKDITALRYHLEKLLKFGVVKANPNASVNISRYAESSSRPVSPTEKGTGSDGVSKKASELFQRHEHINRASLPDDIRTLYDLNTTSYKEMRVYMEKMKLAHTDEDRVKFRSKMTSLSTSIRRRWRIIDSFLAGEYVSQKTPVPPSDKSFNPNTYRATISKYLKKETLTDEERQICVERAKALIDNHYVIKESTLSALQDKGLMPQ